MVEPVREFQTTVAESGQTLATALRHWLPGESWRQVKRRIANRTVSVGGTLCVDQGRKLAVGEVVQLRERPLPAPPTQDQVVLRYVDEHLIVAEKPAGMTTERHAAERHWPLQRKRKRPTFDESVAELLRVREKLVRAPRVRCVHRIDRDTSGLLLLARTAAAEQGLIAQFASRSVQRRYLAVVHGLPTAGVIRSRLVRDRGDGLRGSTAQADLGQEAVTHIAILNYWRALSLIECRLETGRTHQIRIHLAEAGHPVCGDSVYRSAYGVPPIADTSGAPRLALHAAELGFEHPEKQIPLSFEMPLPGDLAAWIERSQRSQFEKRDAPPSAE